MESKNYQLIASAPQELKPKLEYSDMDLLAQPKEKPFKMVKLPGKGFGLVATTTIPRGRRIFSEAPLIKILRLSNDNGATEQYHKLKDEEKEQISALCNVRDDLGHLMGIIYTNAIPLGPPLPGQDDGEAGLFVIASRINHACAPNVNQAWDEAQGMMRFHATREIQPGEEITTSYIHGFRPFRIRQEHLKSVLGFECQCQLCQLPELLREQSDDRIRDIIAIQSALPYQIMSKPLEQSLKAIATLLELYKEESIADWSPAMALYCAFQAAKQHGDNRRAVIFAQRGLDVVVAVDGKDSRRASKLRDALRSVACEDEDFSDIFLEEDPNEAKGDEFDQWLFCTGTDTDSEDSESPKVAEISVMEAED